MARLPRLTLPGYPHHIIQRGNNRQLIFADTQDFETMLALLGQTTLGMVWAFKGYFQQLPKEIEEAALATGLVAEAVALGVADERLGQAVHLIVRALPGNSGAIEELPRKLMQELPNFMQPRHIHWRDAMPIGPNGKIDRNGLAQGLAA